ncbi:hypothetical protein BH11MYX4_BH11MYX4_53710 [soil metagenome]
MNRTARRSHGTARKLALRSSLVLACALPWLACSDDHAPGGGPDADASVDTGPPPSETPNETAGARLRPVYEKVSASDGTYTLAATAWWDQQLGEYCRFELAADGATRCLPPHITEETDDYFVESTCSQPDARAVGVPLPSTGCGFATLAPKARWMSLPIKLAKDCSGKEIRRLPDASRLFPSVLYQLKNGICQAVSVPTDHAYYEVSKAVKTSPQDFVSADVSEVDGPTSGPRLRAVYRKYAGSDGSSALSFSETFDAQRGLLCGQVKAADGVPRCLPKRRPWRDAYLDGACSKPARVLGAVDTCKADARDGAFLGEPVKLGACNGTRVRQMPSAPGNLAWFNLNGAVCQAAQGLPGEYALDEADVLAQPEEAPASFAPLTPTVRPWRETDGYGKPGAQLALMLHEYSSDDGFKELIGQELSDPTTGGECARGVSEDGAIRCVPSSTRTHYATVSSSKPLYFADPTCTQPVWGYAPDLCEPPADARFVREYVSNGTCTSVVRISEIPATPLTLAKLYQLTANVCVAAPLDPSKLRLFLQSERKSVPPTSFPKLETEYLTR